MQIILVRPWMSVGRRHHREDRGWSRRRIRGALRVNSGRGKIHDHKKSYKYANRLHGSPLAAKLADKNRRLEILGVADLQLSRRCQGRVIFPRRSGCQLLMWGQPPSAVRSSELDGSALPIRTLSGMNGLQTAILHFPTPGFRFCEQILLNDSDARTTPTN